MNQPFQFANGQLAYSAEDLLKLCQQFPDDGVNYLVREDLEKWLAYIGQDDIAQFAATARQTPLDDRQKLEEFLTKCHALSSPEAKTLPEEESNPVPAPEPKPIVEAKPVVETKPEAAKETTTSIKQPQKAQSSIPADSTATKPSFFEVIAKFFINILYRNKN